MINTILKYAFWITWSVELIFILWMTWDELKLKHLAMPAYIPLGILWLLVALIIKTIIKSDKSALIMVAIPGVPLLFMIGFILVVYIVDFVAGPIRWN